MTALPGSADTIVARATAAGRGAVAIVRVSGALVETIASTLLGALPMPRVATLARIVDADGEAIDDVLALYFPAPHSYTGESVLELQGHGGAIASETLVERMCALGARRAAAGEFTQRAYLNDKMDLAQAEAVADLIDAGSRAAARAALHSLQGEFSKRAHALAEALTQLRVWLEAAIDFPEEEIDFLGSAELAARFDDVIAQLDVLQAEAARGRVLTEGAVVVIAGKPNAGKSTLMNALAGYDAAIVTPVAGTTRDVLRERIEIDGVPVMLIDTAGLREEGETTDPIELEGIRRARAEIARADHVLHVIDASEEGVEAVAAWAISDGAVVGIGRAGDWPAGVPITPVWNKIDIARAINVGRAAIAVSARTGQGLDALRAHLAVALGKEGGNQGGAFSARARHLECLAAAREHLQEARAHRIGKRGELAAEELRAAQTELGQLTGEVTQDALLGQIFSSFCIGK